MHKALLLAGGAQLQLQMYGDIGEHFIFRDGIGPTWLAERLKENPNVELINIKLSSAGGNAFDGMTMRSMLASHPAKVEIDVEGLAASVASVLCTAADRVRMHQGSSYMMHTARGNTFGDDVAHQKSINRLRAISDEAALLYAQRCGKPKEEMLELMRAETWLTPDQALERGLVDEVVRGKNVTAPKSVRLHFDLGRYGYEHVPADVMHACRSAFLLRSGAEDDERGDHGSLHDDDNERTDDMSLTAIALALGANGNADESAVLHAIDRMKQQHQRSTSLMVELRAITKRDNDEEVLGALRGMAEAAAQVPKLLSDASSHAAALDAQKRVTLLAADKADPKGRKLTPALEKHYESRSVSELEAFLQVAPHVLSIDGKPVKQPKTVAADGGGGGNDDSEIELKWKGKKWGELKPQERHELYVDNREQYAAMRAQQEQR
jgi:ATP-dependent protease ClpP protease subunit